MAEDDVARLLAGQPLELPGNARPFPTETLDVPVVRLLDDRGALVPGMRSFRHDDDAEPRAPRIAVADALHDLVQVVRDLRNQDDVCAAGDTAVQRDPPRIPAHDLDDHD